MKTPTVLAMITARGGSVGLPRKNILPFAGKPLIAHSITPVLPLLGTDIDRLIVSTDDEEIAEISRKFGADVPFMRPEELARSETASMPVVQHAVAFAESEKNITYDWVLLLQPTSPLRLQDDITAALKMAFSEPKATAVISVTNAEDSHPIKLKRLREDGVLQPFSGETFKQTRRQDFEFTVYKTNGAIYLTRRDIIMEQDGFYGDHPLAYEMPMSRSLDIDTAFDFKLAEFVYNEGL